MEKEEALEAAIELAKFSLSAYAVKENARPTNKSGEDVADFIETLAKRLTEI